LIGGVRHLIAGDEFVEIDLSCVLGVHVAAELLEDQVPDQQHRYDGHQPSHVGRLRQVRWHLFEDVQVAHLFAETHSYPISVA